MAGASCLPEVATDGRWVSVTPRVHEAAADAAGHRVPVPRRRQGTTVLELLVALAVVAILSSLGALGLRAPPARLAANGLQAAVQQARFDAIRANRPMVVEIDPNARAVRVSSAIDAAAVACDGATLVRAVTFSDDARVSVEAGGFPFVWLPSGQPRTCDGGPLTLAGASASVSDGYRSLNLHLGSGGEVVIR